MKIIRTLFFIISVISFTGIFNSVKAQRDSIILAPSSSESFMYGINEQRTRVYNSKGLNEPKSLIWQSKKLFSFKDYLNYTARNGPFTIFGSLPTGYGVSHPILYDGTFYFTLSVENGYVYYMDAATGKEKKVIRLKNVSLSPPAISGDFVYLGGSDGSLFAMNRQTGEIKWQINKKDYEFNVAAPVIMDNIMYFAGAEFGKVNRSITPDGTVHALDLTKGEQKWMFKIKGIPTSIAIAGDTILFGDMENQLFAIDRNTGKEKWRFKAEANVKPASIMGNNVFFSDEKGNIYSVNLKTGQLQWTQTKIKASGAFAVLNDSVFFAGWANSLVALDTATGNDKWLFKTKDGCVAPVIANGVIYTSCSDKIIHAVDAATGQEKWNYSVKNQVVMAPLVGDGIMYFFDVDGYMYALQ